MFFSSSNDLYFLFTSYVTHMNWSAVQTRQQEDRSCGLSFRVHAQGIFFWPAFEMLQSEAVICII